MTCIGLLALSVASALVAVGIKAGPDTNRADGDGCLLPLTTMEPEGVAYARSTDGRPGPCH